MHFITKQPNINSQHHLVMCGLLRKDTIFMGGVLILKLVSWLPVKENMTISKPPPPLYCICQCEPVYLLVMLNTAELLKFSPRKLMDQLTYTKSQFISKLSLDLIQSVLYCSKKIAKFSNIVIIFFFSASKIGTA